MKLDEIGIWSEIKLDIIKEYANAFTKIMKSQEWCKGYVYIDAFAGPGVHISRRTGEFIPGSPLNALEIDNPFTEYHYIDIDKEKKEIPEIPLEVLREALVNAIVHRDYFEEGAGINRMRQSMAARNIEVKFDTGDFFIVTLARPESTRKEVTDQVKKLLRALKTREKSGKKLIEELKLKHKPTFRMNYLKPAIEAGLIELTIPEKPKSRFQKYRLTKKGTRYCGKIVDNRE